MTFSFNASLSGLNANSNALNVVGNNIANANTTGFRGADITFADVIAGAGGARLNGAGNSLQIGNGVRTSAIHTNFNQGDLDEASSSLQAAIQGKGFFVTKANDGTSNYTRAGDFTTNKEGFLVAPNGNRVQGFMAQNGAIAPGTPLTDLKIPFGQTIAPQVTSQATLRMNLNAESPTGAVFHAPIQVHDSLGVERTLDFTFTKQADGSFQTTGTLDGIAVQLDADGAGASASPVSFVFDSNGQLTSPQTLSVVPDQSQLDGAALPSININIREANPDGTLGAFNVTGYARPSAVSSTVQNGFAAGELVGATVDANGVIYGNFSNTQSRIVGQYGVAVFNSEESLQRLGGNMFGETLSSGQATIGEAGTGGRGLIAGGYLEKSNVNITNEFVELIQAQRGFQANSRVITSLNQTFQDLLQII